MYRVVKKTELAYVVQKKNVFGFWVSKFKYTSPNKAKWKLKKMLDAKKS